MLWGIVAASGIEAEAPGATPASLASNWRQNMQCHAGCHEGASGLNMRPAGHMRCQRDAHHCHTALTALTATTPQDKAGGKSKPSAPPPKLVRRQSSIQRMKKALGCAGPSPVA